MLFEIRPFPGGAQIYDSFSLLFIIPIWEFSELMPSLKASQNHVLEQKRAGTLFASLHSVPLFCKLLIVSTKGKKLVLVLSFFTLNYLIINKDLSFFLSSS